MRPVLCFGSEDGVRIQAFFVGAMQGLGGLLTAKITSYRFTRVNYLMSRYCISGLKSPCSQYFFAISEVYSVEFKLVAVVAFVT